MFEKNDSLRFYEEVLVLHPEVSLSDQKTFFANSEKTIKEFKGKVHNLDTWGMRSLANPSSKKIKQGIYFHMIFSGASGLIAELRRKLSISDKVVYFHHEKLDQNVDPNKYLENYKDALKESLKKEEEREAKFQKKKMS